MLTNYHRDKEAKLDHHLLQDKEVVGNSDQNLLQGKVGISDHHPLQGKEVGNNSDHQLAHLGMDMQVVFGINMIRMHKRKHTRVLHHLKFSIAS